MTLGEKIKQYRTEKGVSQLDLELDIETSPGRISKIENDKINPDKETIVKIAYALKLDTNEVASLFGIELPHLSAVFDLINEMLLAKDAATVIDKTVNDLIFKLGFIASAFFTVEHKDKVYMRGLTMTSLAQKALAQLTHPLDDRYMLLSKDIHNLTVKALQENTPQLTNFTRDYCSPLVTIEEANNIQTATGDKSAIIFPLVVENEKLGAVSYVKKIESKFEKEREILEIVSKQIAIALHHASQ